MPEDSTRLGRGVERCRGKPTDRSTNDHRVPRTVPAGVSSWRFLKEQKEPAPGRFDPYGFVLSASGLGSVLYGLAEAGSRGFDDPFVIFFLIAGAVLAHGLRFRRTPHQRADDRRAPLQEPPFPGV